MIDSLLAQDDSQFQREKLQEFQKLINNVWEGIIDWQKRNKFVPEEARGLGVIEANVGHTIARRFKHRCASWTPSGAINLAKVRCAVRNGNLIDLMRLSGPLPVEVEEGTNEIKIFNSYWFKRQADGLRKVDPVDWCKTSLPAIYGPSQKERDLANLVGRLTLDWLF